MSIKEAYTAQELAPVLGYKHARNIRDRATRESWTPRPRVGRGGGREWPVASMPESTRLAIRQAEEARAVAAASEALVPAVSSVAGQLLSPTANRAILDDRRREKALAKADLLRKYLEWQRRHGATRAQKAAFVLAYLGGAWPQLMAELGDKVSWKSLERWKLEQDRAGSVLALADKRGIAHRGRSLLTEAHKMIILGHILHPNAPKISQCVRQIQKRCVASELFEPSEATLRRWVNTYMTECFDEFTLWREGKKAWNDKCVMSILRDWSLVDVGDIVFADGHTLNFETLNPETGKPCRMTLLLFYDGASNHPLGWEIMASENVACISSAFRRTCLLLGKFPRVVYLDNGRAFRAKFFKGCPDFTQAGFLGLYEDLGCKVIHAWAYHGQTKTVERFFGTFHDMEVWTPSYTGNDIAHKPARMKRGEDMHRKLYDMLGGRPLTLEETHIEVARWFSEYVQRPQWGEHMGGYTPAERFAQGRGPGLTTAETERMTLLMMQKEIRTITKDGFSLHGRTYWHEALTGRRHPVLVRYDNMLNPFTVRVYTLDGQYICEARDRAHFRIASGIHPAAAILGTEAQRQELEAAMATKKGQEKRSTAMFRTMLDAVVKPETQARLEALEHNTLAEGSTAQRSAKARILRATKPKALTQNEIAAVEAAAEKGRAALEAAPSYTPSVMKRFRDEPERYAYLFAVRFEQGLELVPDDQAWMESFENTPNFQRNFKARYEALRGLFENWGDAAQTA